MVPQTNRFYTRAALDAFMACAPGTHTLGEVDGYWTTSTVFSGGNINDKWTETTAIARTANYILKPSKSAEYDTKADDCCEGCGKPIPVRLGGVCDDCDIHTPVERVRVEDTSFDVRDDPSLPPLSRKGGGA